MKNKISPRYIVDSSGKKIQVILDISTFDLMMKKLESLDSRTQEEQTLEIDFDEVNKKILKDKA